MEILKTGLFFIIHTKTKRICHIIRIIRGLYADKQNTIQWKKATQYDLGDQSHRRVYKLQILKNDELLNKL